MSETGEPRDPHTLEETRYLDETVDNCKQNRMYAKGIRDSIEELSAYATGIETTSDRMIEEAHQHAHAARNHYYEMVRRVASKAKENPKSTMASIGGVIVLTLCLVIPTSSRQTPESFRERADELARNAKFAEALVVNSNGITRFPEHLHLILQRADFLEATGRYRDSRNWLTEKNDLIEADEHCSVDERHIRERVELRLREFGELE